MKSKESFLLFKSFYEPTKHLSRTQKGELYEAIFEYQISEIEPKKESTIYPFFLFFKNQFRLDNIKYSKRTNANQANGLLGGRPKKQDNPNNPMGLNKAKKGDNVNDNGKDKDKEDKKIIIKKAQELPKKETENLAKRSKKFIPPSLEEVKAFCLERKNNINPQSFIDNNQSKGWVVGRSPMKDWKAAVRTWENNNFNQKTTTISGEKPVSDKERLANNYSSKMFIATRELSIKLGINPNVLTDEQIKQIRIDVETNIASEA